MKRMWTVEDGSGSTRGKWKLVSVTTMWAGMGPTWELCGFHLREGSSLVPYIHIYIIQHTMREG